MEREELSALWRQEGRKYAADINEFVRIGMASNWQQKQQEPEEDKRHRLAGQVLKQIKAANQTGSIAELREQFPPATWPFTNSFSDKMQAVEPIAVMDNGGILVQISNSAKPQIYIADANSIEVFTNIYSAGVSPDGNYIALADDKEIRVIAQPDRKLQGTVAARYEWTALQRRMKEILPEYESLADQDKPASHLTKIVPFSGGQSLLLVSSAGTFLVEQEQVTLLHPDPAIYGAAHEDEDEEDRYIGDAMVHGAVSPDNRWIAYGGQCSEHLLLDVEKREAYRIEPLSSYPHYCSFSPDSKEVWFNACHFYNGETIKVTISELTDDPADAAADKEWPSVNDEMRVYAAAPTSQGQILGDAYGYLRLISSEGEELWRHFVGSTISGLAVSADEALLAVGTYGGMLHLIDLQSGEKDAFTIGTAPIKEIARWILWKDEPPLRW
ncbi:WD40 repeat domain-containing protein [Paenibacillus sp. GCM10027626]|uniref:WD40 repeat domain-containing protein n=1 Tax=Paenibacillus sp. GCM10027626 TaxID=3273411 RepID=UPI0036359ACB